MRFTSDLLLTAGPWSTPAKTEATRPRQIHALPQGDVSQVTNIQTEEQNLGQDTDRELKRQGYGFDDLMTVLIQHTEKLSRLTESDTKATPFRVDLDPSMTKWTQILSINRGIIRSVANTSNIPMVLSLSEATNADPLINQTIPANSLTGVYIPFFRGLVLQNLTAGGRLYVAGDYF